MSDLVSNVSVGVPCWVDRLGRYVSGADYGGCVGDGGALSRREGAELLRAYFDAFGCIARDGLRSGVAGGNFVRADDVHHVCGEGSQFCGRSLSAADCCRGGAASGVSVAGDGCGEPGSPEIASSVLSGGMRGGGELESGQCSVAKVIESVVADVPVRGKHWKKNKAKKAGKKRLLSMAVGSDAGGRVPLLEGANEEQRKEFVASRLQMMTARNNLLAAKAVDQKKYVDDRAFTRVAERKLELERLEIDAKLKKLEEVNGNDFGFDGCTVASEPSLSTGTVSPNSSISVAEEMRLRRAVAKLQTQLKDTQLVLELERTVGGKEKDELKEKYALAVNANLEKVAGGLVIKTSSTGKEFLGMANELDDDGESYPDIEFSQPSFNGEEVW